MKTHRRLVEKALDAKPQITEVETACGRVLHPAYTVFHRRSLRQQRDACGNCLRANNV